MPSIPGVTHQRAVRALRKAGFEIVREGEHIVMSDGRRILTIPRANPINAFTMGGIARDAGLGARRWTRPASSAGQRRNRSLDGAVSGRPYPESVYFRLRSEITDIEVIARGVSVRERARLRAQFGAGRWRKMKGVALVEVRGGSTRRAEVPWYEAHGLGRRKLKIKRFLD